ncbi:MAG: hypothetical protein JKY37_05560 [Nannocystaceae bacterium]|nr:hypothetical protein [Nannocystaceae bacterium]
MIALARRLAVVAGLLSSSACSEDALIVELELRSSDCTPEQLAAVKMLSVDVFGFRNSNETCNLQKRCVDVLEAPVSIEDLAEVLRTQAQQPLIDTQLEGATQINIVGRTEAGSCFKAEQFPVCGRADLADVTDDGVLAITMRCEQCVSEAFPQCP